MQQRQSGRNVEDYIEREHFTDRLHSTSVICPVNACSQARCRADGCPSQIDTITPYRTCLLRRTYIQRLKARLSLTRVAVPPSPPSSTIFPPPPAARFSFRFAARKTIRRRSVREWETTTTSATLAVTVAMKHARSNCKAHALLVPSTCRLVLSPLPLSPDSEWNKKNVLPLGSNCAPLTVTFPRVCRRISCAGTTELPDMKMSPRQRGRNSKLLTPVLSSATF